MSIFKADTMLMLLGLVLFGILIAFATGVFDPLMDKIGISFTTLVDNVFSGAGMDWGGAGRN